MKTEPRNRFSIVGCCFAATYLVFLVVVNAATTDPSKADQDWLPMHILAMPWYALDKNLYLHGFVANFVLFYLLGAILRRLSSVVGEWEAKLRKHVSTWGCYFAAAYVSFLIVVFEVTAALTKPSNVGLDWIPFVVVARSWFGLDAGPLFPGFVTNTVFLYLLGAILQKISLIVGEWG